MARTKLSALLRNTQSVWRPTLILRRLGQTLVTGDVAVRVQHLAAAVEKQEPHLVGVLGRVDVPELPRPPGLGESEAAPRAVGRPERAARELLDLPAAVVDLGAQTVAPVGRQTSPLRMSPLRNRVLVLTSEMRSAAGVPTRNTSPHNPRRATEPFTSLAEAVSL